MAALEDNLANLRVASFSYYIDDPLPSILSQEVSSREKPSIIKPSHNSNISKSIEVSPENVFFRVKSPPKVHDLNAAVYASSNHLQRMSTSSSNNGEIGVFGADKYFNMPLEYNTTGKNEHEKKQGPVDLPGLNLNLRPRTPSISSEASSWNSQAALLRNLSRDRPRKANRRRIFASFGCSGHCLEKGAVSISENRRKDAKRLDQFAFPVLHHNSGSNARVVTIKKPPILMKDDHEKGSIIEEGRKSLEIFGSGRMKNGDIAMKLARNLSMLTWDAIPNSTNASITSLGSTTICHDQDMTSDASSDLFEIEDISGAGYSLLSNLEDENRDEDGNVRGNNIVAHEYAPSEASIEWSVVTASAAADISSVISDYDEKYVGVSGIHTDDSCKRKCKTKNPDGKEAHRGRPGGLLGCKSHKAVNVAETVVHNKSRVVERY